MSCKCQGCGKRFKVDFIVPDELWEKIKPEEKPPGSGLLCGSCICDRIEDRNQYDSFQLFSNEIPGEANTTIEDYFNEEEE